MWIKFRSLRSQFLLIILGITVSLVLIMGFLDLQTVTTTSTRIATMSLNWQAQRTSAPIQSTLTEAKDMTDALARSLEADIDDPRALRARLSSSRSWIIWKNSSICRRKVLPPFLGIISSSTVNIPATPTDSGTPGIRNGKPMYPTPLRKWDSISTRTGISGSSSRICGKAASLYGARLTMTTISQSGGSPMWYRFTRTSSLWVLWA